MAFPISPANNQTALVNGIVYQWNASLGVWKRNGSVNSIQVGQLLLNSAQQSTSNGSGTLIVSGGAGITGNVYTGGIFITGAANGITFADGSVQTTGATGIDSYARTTANTNATNITVIQAVNTTQNTNITAADTKAQAAFNAANTKFSSSGGTITGDTVVTGNLTVTGTQFYANTVNLTVVDNIITLNSNVTGAPTLSAGIEVNRGSSSNTKLLWSEANTSWEFTNNGTFYDKIAGQTYANAAFLQANTGTTLAQASFNTANTNATNITIIQGVDLTQNTNIAAADAKAQAAFNAANTVSPLDSYARTTANTARDNIVIIQGVDATQNTNITNVDTKAQAAFDKANTAAASGSVLTSTVDEFTGDGSTTAFTLSVEPASINYTTAVVGGVMQPRSAYSVLGTTITFTSAPVNGQIVEVTTIGTSNTTLYTVTTNVISPFLLMGA